MVGNTVHLMIGGKRDRCSHNLRFRLQGKSNICLICQCNKIDDLLYSEVGGNRKLSSEGISEIIHQFRIINSVLDAPIEEKHVEALISPVLRTSAALLKIHNDEVGAVVAQALDKINSKVPMNMLEDFLEKLSAQILEKISNGNLDCLAVLIRRKECRNSFLRNHGFLVLPKLFQTLGDHVPNLTKTATGSSQAMQSAEINKENQKYSGGDDASTATGKDSLKIVERLFDVIDANCPNDLCIVFSSATAEEQLDEKRCLQKQQSFLPSQQAFRIYDKYLKEIILSCVHLLSCGEIVKMTSFSTKILNFLGKLHHYPESLRCLFSDKTGKRFCSMIKKLLFTHCTDIKTAALSLVHRMVVTYKSVMEESNADKTFIAEFPDAISEVDLISFITEAMNTSCENLFRATIQVLDQINSIPQFRCGIIMIPVLEQTLRISAMHIPDNVTAFDTYTSLNNLLLNILTSLENVPPPGIQRQLIYLFEKLPTNWTALQYLSWIKLLLFCTEGELEGNLWSLFHSFVHRSKDFGSCSYVVQLECVLLIAYALMKCKCPQAEHCLLGCTEQQQFSNRKEELTEQLMHFLMDSSFVPTITALVRYGTSDDSMYITTLLELLKSYPPEYLSVRHSQSSFDYQICETAKVTFGCETGEEGFAAQEKQDAVYEITVDQSSAIKINDVWCWSAKFYMQILAAIRLNPEFMTSRQLFDLWNENVAKIISVCYPLYLPQLRNACGNNPSFEGENDYENDNPFDHCKIKQILEKLNIDASAWAKEVGQNDFVLNGIGSLEQRKHDMILAFYFCFALFAGKDVMQFLDSDFVQRYATFLDECIGQYDLTQEENTKKEFDWTQMSYQFRVALMIASALPHDVVEPISDKLERFVLEVEEAKSRFTDEILIYHCDVFIFNIKWKIFSEYVSLVERWLREDRNGCISFYSNGDFNEEINEEINNSLLTIAAEGEKETSLLAVELGCKRLKNLKFSFSFNCVIASIHNLCRRISFEDSMETEVLEDQNSLDLLRLSNVMQLAINDDYLFCSDKKFPFDFLHQVVRIMLNFHAVAMIGRRCLELLSKILRDTATFQNVNTYLMSHRNFINFLGSRLEFNDKNDVEESIFAYKLLALLIQQNLESFSSDVNTSQGPPWIQWKLTPVFSILHSVPKIEILEFLVAICKVNFKCPLIKVEELIEGPDMFGKILLNLLFHLQTLSQKITFRDSQEAVWEIICQILRLASEKNEIVNYSRFGPDVLFQQWMKVAVIHLLAGCNHVASKAPLMSLEFLEKWTKMLLVNLLENPTERTPFQQSFVFQPYVTLFKTVLKDMKTDPSQVTSEEKAKKTPEKQQKHFSAPESLPLFEIEKKSLLISKIKKNCSIFLTNFNQ